MNRKNFTDYGLGLYDERERIIKIIEECLDSPLLEDKKKMIINRIIGNYLKENNKK